MKFNRSSKQAYLLITYPNLNCRGVIKLTSLSVKVVWMPFPICNQSRIEKVSEYVVTRFYNLDPGGIPQPTRI